MNLFSKSMVIEMTREKREKIVRFDEAKLWRRILDLLLLTLLVTLIVEGFNQGSAARMADYLIHRPIYFAFNCLVVLASLCLTELFRPRRALGWTLSILWIILGFSNYMVCRNRTQPLVGGDLIITREIRDGKDIFGQAAENEKMVVTIRR